MDYAAHDAAANSLRLSCFSEPIFTPEQIEAIAKAIEAAIDAHKHAQHTS